MDNIDKKHKVAIYIRVGHPEDSMEVESQKKYANDYLKKNNYINNDINYYIDKGISANSFKYQFDTLVNDYKQNKFDLIITKELSRLGRGTNIIPRLEKAGIPLNKIKFANGSDDLVTMQNFLEDRFNKIKKSKINER